MTTQLQNEIIETLKVRGNGAVSKILRPFLARGKANGFFEALDALAAAGKIVKDGDMVELIDDTPVDHDSDVQ